MPLSEMYMRVIPSEWPQVGGQRAIPTGPMEAVTGTITTVDPEGVVILKLPSGVLLVGYCAKLKPGFDIRRVTESGAPADPNEELWIYNTVERR
jgi:hypothetical protein